VCEIRIQHASRQRLASELHKEIREKQNEPSKETKEQQADTYQFREEQRMKIVRPKESRSDGRTQSGAGFGSILMTA